ncbi:MAG: hypothetical protein SGPRY_001783 [Prymnesium sp.]
MLLSLCSSLPHALPARVKVAVIGAGVAGLRCAEQLASAGCDVHVLEASDGVGGRVRSDLHPEGFILDRGFQVFLDFYPEARLALDLASLELDNFIPGALVLGKEQRPLLIADPRRYPQALFATVLSPLASARDKLALALAIIRLKFLDLEQIMTREEYTTQVYLSENVGLSAGLISSFFQPFLQGVFLSPLTRQSSRMFDFVVRAFVDGSACLPRHGIGAISEQLATSAMDAGAVISLDRRVCRLETGHLADCRAHTVHLSDGGALECDALVIATDQPSAERLLDKTEDEVGEASQERTAAASTVLYFALDGEPPVSEPILLLNAEAQLDGCTINNIRLSQKKISFSEFACSCEAGLEKKWPVGAFCDVTS